MCLSSKKCAVNLKGKWFTLCCFYKSSLLPPIRRSFKMFMKYFDLEIYLHSLKTMKQWKNLFWSLINKQGWHPNALNSVISVYVGQGVVKLLCSFRVSVHRLDGTGYVRFITYYTQSLAYTYRLHVCMYC